MPTATSKVSSLRGHKPVSRESANTRAARLFYNINTRDQITGSEHGGPLHVSGTLNRPGKIASTGSTETPTALDGSFSAWFILLDNEPYHYIYTQKDHLGSNRNGYAYDAYGNLTDWDNEAPPWFERLYTGHLYDASAGLYLAPYRSYDPELGRWLSREPLGLDGPNLYHYVFNDPGNGIDKTGLFREYVFDPYLYSDFGYYYFDTIRNMFTDGWIDGSLNGQITRYVPPQSQNLARNAMWGSLAVSGAATGGAGYLVGGEALGSCGIYNVGAIVTRRAAAKAAGAHGRHYSETLTRELLRNGVRSKGEGWNQYLIRFKDGQGEIAWRWTDRTVVHHNPFKFYR